MQSHRLSEVDREAKTAVCSVCGPTKIKVFGDRGRRCLHQVRKSQKIYRDRRHQRPEGWVIPRYPYAKRDPLKRRMKDGRTVPEQEAVVKAQGGLCAICKLPKRLIGDHCHASGKPRGMLCYKCNHLLGMANDDPAILRAALRYLRKHAVDRDSTAQNQ